MLKIGFTSFIVIVGLSLTSCFFTQKEGGKTGDSSTINGISLEGPSDPIDAVFYDELKEINANWVCLMPYAYSERDQADIIYKNLKWQWWGEGQEGTRESSLLAHEKGLKVMIKPHLWLGHNQFTGDLTMDNDEDWVIWESGYHTYIMDYARIAEATNAELFCIGTELESFVKNRPLFWDQLILDIRKVYKGKLTYAANWNEFSSVPFWTQLDFIGIDAYFPLSKKISPSIASLNDAWKPWIKKIGALSDQTKIPVIFTEYGYQSVSQCASTPWSVVNTSTDNQSQYNAYEALYQSCWNETWMAGGFLWKWHVPDHEPETRVNQFTPQFKPALELVNKWYGQPQVSTE